MSTDRVEDEAKAAREALSTLSRAADAAVSEIDDELRQAQGDYSDITRGATVALRSVDDRVAGLREERSQLAPPTPSPTDGQPPAQTPAQPAERLGPNGERIVDLTRVEEQPPAAEPLVPGLRENDERDPWWGHWPDWSPFSWLLALLGGLFGAWVAQKTHADLDSSVLFEVFWYVLMIGTFAALFGWIAAVVGARSHRQRQA